MFDLSHIGNFCTILCHCFSLFHIGEFNFLTLSPLFLLHLFIYLFFYAFHLVVVGGESHHQFTGLPGAANRSRKAGGSLGGKLRPGLPLSHRRWRAP